VPPSAKLEAFKELIADCVGSGRKVLVFSQFVEMQKLLGEALDELEIEYLWLHGGTKNREELVRSSSSKDGPAGVPHQPQGRRQRPDPHRGRHGDPLRPVVEPGGRGSGDRPRAPHRSGQAGHGLPLVVEDTVEQKMVELGQAQAPRSPRARSGATPTAARSSRSRTCKRAARLPRGLGLG
jgi:hypothetical protein